MRPSVISKNPGKQEQRTEPATSVHCWLQGPFSVRYNAEEAWTEPSPNSTQIHLHDSQLLIIPQITDPCAVSLVSRIFISLQGSYRAFFHTLTTYLYLPSLLARRSLP